MKKLKLLIIILLSFILVGCSEYTDTETEVVITENNAIDYLMNTQDLGITVFDGKGNHTVYYNYNNLIKSEVEKKSNLHSIISLEVTDKSVTINSSYDDTIYYTVVVKGNCKGYSDDYNTKLVTLTFDVVSRIYSDGKIYYEYTQVR